MGNMIRVRTKPRKICTGKKSVGITRGQVNMTTSTTQSPLNSILPKSGTSIPKDENTDMTCDDVTVQLGTGNAIRIQTNLRKVDMTIAAEDERRRQKRGRSECDLFKPDAKVVKDTQKKKYKVISLNKHIHVVRSESKTHNESTPDSTQVKVEKKDDSRTPTLTLSRPEIEVAEFLDSCSRKRIAWNNKTNDANCAKSSGCFRKMECVAANTNDDNRQEKVRLIRRLRRQVKAGEGGQGEILSKQVKIKNEVL